MRKIGQLAIESSLIALSVVIALQLYLRVNFIPKFLFSYQQGFYVLDEKITILLVYLVTGTLILYISKLVNFGSVFLSPRFFVREIFLVALSSSVSALVIFIFTKVFFDPNLVLIQTLAVVALFIAGYIIAGMRSGGVAVAPIGKEGFRYLFSVSGILILAITASPVPMALAFKKSKDFANTINRIRNVSDGIGLQWQLVDAYPNLSVSQPILVRFHENSDDTVFVLERAGRILTLDRTGAKTTLLDYSSRVGQVEVENGAVGFALHPAFNDSQSPHAGFVYCYYTDVTEDRQVNRLSRFDVSLPTPAERLASETVLIELQRNKSGFHNGGSVEFGPDGFLYVGIGDANDHTNLQTISKSLFSGIIRIDVDSKGGDISHPIRKQPQAGATANYMIPSDNPFVGQEGALEEFWALGLRNPFRFTFDPETKALWVGDVGAEQVEEVDIVEPGGNYQYPYFEGTRRTESAMPDPIIGAEAPPYFDYRHKANERAVIGGMVYRGDKFPRLKGKYIFADNAAGQLYWIDSDRPGQTEKPTVAKIDLFGYVGMTSIAQSPSGDILVTALGSKSEPSGQVLKLEPRDATFFADVATMAARLVGHEPGKPHVHGEGFTAMQAATSYTENCSRCHGADGRGSSELESDLARIIPDLTDPAWHAQRTDDDLFTAILKGGEGIGKSDAMPPWEGVLDDSEIKAMVTYIRTFAQ